MKEPRQLESSLIAFIPKLPSGRYISYKDGEKTKGKLKRYMVRNTESNLERIDVVWPTTAKMVGPNFILGLFAEQLRTAASVEQFLSIMQFKEFQFHQSLEKAFITAKSLSNQQFEQMLKTGSVPL